MSDLEEFIYLYDLSKFNLPDFLSETEQITIQHWEFLQKLKRDKYLLLAGITLDCIYEFVVLQAKDRDTAAQLFNVDPYSDLCSVKGQLYPFRASLFTTKEIEKTLLADDFNLDSFYSSPNPLFMGTITGRPTFVNDITEEESRIMGIHFQHLKKNFDEGKLILAGPILEEGMFGLSVFYANNLEEAKEFMENDPAVISKILEPGVHPLRVLLIGKK